GQRQVAAKSGESACFTDLLEPLNVHGAVVTADALHTVREHADWLVTTKNADYIMIVKGNQKHLHRQLKHLPWSQVPLGEATRDHAHGRDEIRRLKVCTVDGLLFPHAAQAVQVKRRRTDQVTGKTTITTVYAVSRIHDSGKPEAEHCSATSRLREGAPRSTMWSTGRRSTALPRLVRIGTAQG
ncbi:ISAs1 family transposase, partial [Actinomadura adrarensis]